MRTLVMLAALAVSVPAVTNDATGRAQLNAIDQSGIRAQVFFVDNGSTLWVLGVAEGLDPTKAYISLVYGQGSFPGGPSACEPTTDLTHLLTFPQMLIGAWTVDTDGSGVLSAKKTGTSYVPVGAAGTISVRQFIAPMNAP